MFKRLKETILEIIQQADLILLGLCCAASVFGIAMIYSATRYNNDNRKIIVQTAALLIGIVVYFGLFTSLNVFLLIIIYFNGFEYRSVQILFGSLRKKQ